MFRSVKGFHDIYGPDIHYWNVLERALKELYASYGFCEFRLPVLEKTALFKRGIGETTDIVEKEMFTFTDADGESVSLRPEGTASLMRAYLENGLGHVPGVKKYFYMGNMFRRERPQKGRFRQFTQSGVEILETESPLADAEVIGLLYNTAAAAGVEDLVRMEINSIGCAECRPAYRAALTEYYSSHSADLCEDCLRRLDKNPLRLLDCKKERCRQIASSAPVILDYLCPSCSGHFDDVKKYLDISGVPFSVNPGMVRGLDYYVKTAYELVTDRLGAASAVGAGGRYDGLVKLMGGPDVPGIGFAVGMDRMVTLMKEKESAPEKGEGVYVVFFGEGEEAAGGLKIVEGLRKAGLRVSYDYERASMKSQMKKSDRARAKAAVILGPDEMSRGEASVKNLESGAQETVSVSELTEFLKKL